MSVRTERPAKAAAPALPYRFFDLHVLRAERLSPAMVRITFGAEDLRDIVSGGRDQRFKLFLPQAGQDAPVLPEARDENWWTEWRAMDPAVRAYIRTYTVRALRHGPDGPEEMDVDFAVHTDANGHGGPATNWAQAARPGDRVTVLCPVVEENGGVDFQPPAGTDWTLITADETALPAVAATLSWLPAGSRAKVWIEVPHTDDIQDLPTEADADITWLIRGGASATPVLDAVRAAEFPAGSPYAWIAGEASGVRALRRHLVGERGLDRRAVTFTGYWRRGASEEDLLAELA
ncbi:sialic acid transporter [Streptomyces eurocidicus]|uniref:NADPH-dependent ferric siderophore reductase n=1 Tax=Streptomyces eurocidicus TaxID=66423 RepID=A0A2N8NMN9_STREU|nr:siderophore-interacting protein [Streptomyces eurocidicus]MBB5120772.1 NADPH-dependent ferric siderophore reductase [Streptomyces eurocidicus]MBF6050306.1 siderophore-interacting protein [Streptomyces eurocidicus]PNE30039.1 sialic acid transporter [Streptomyces eurocidicus]